jgi:hypothetical protein
VSFVLDETLYRLHVGDAAYPALAADGAIAPPLNAKSLANHSVAQ